MRLPAWPAPKVPLPLLGGRAFCLEGPEVETARNSQAEVTEI